MSKGSRHVNPDGTITVKGEDGKFKGKIGKPQNPKTPQTLPAANFNQISSTGMKTADSIDGVYQKVVHTSNPPSLTVAEAEKLANAKLMVNGLGDQKWVDSDGKWHNENGIALIYTGEQGESFYNFLKTGLHAHELDAKETQKPLKMREKIKMLNESFSTVRKALKFNKEYAKKHGAALDWTHPTELPTQELPQVCFRLWARHGKPFREDGPVVEMGDGRNLWSLNNVAIPERPLNPHPSHGREPVTVKLCNEAYNENTPKDRLIALTTHPHPLVANTAKSTLQRLG